MKPRLVAVGLVAAVALTGWTVAFAGATRTHPDYRPPVGALNPAVTQETIGSTICVPGWTRTVRPPTSFTTPLKQAQIKARHLPGAIADYEEDHWIPLELGGSPADPRNLWPEPILGRHASAGKKDLSENRLKALVCASTITLADAQARIVKPAYWGT